METFLGTMTDNMRRLYMDIMASVKNIPYEAYVYMFGEEGNEDIEWIIGFVNYITLEYIKYSYDYSDPEYPLNHFVDYSNDSERMLQSRIAQYVMKHKKREFERLGIEREQIDKKYSNMDMDTMEKKLSGYRLTEMNFFEHQNIHDLELIKAVVEKRIVSAKKISNDRFIHIFQQYDSFVEDLIERSQKSDEDMVFASLALFTLEWHYPVEMFYLISCIIEDEEIEDYEFLKHVLLFLCSHIKVESQFAGWATTDSRMVKERMILIQFFLDKRHDLYMKQEMFDMIREYIVFGTYYKEVITSTEDGLYKDWFREESNMEDWASFFRAYDIFEIWQKKEWTRKRIQKMRKLFEITLDFNM